MNISNKVSLFDKLANIKHIVNHQGVHTVNCGIDEIVYGRLGKNWIATWGVPGTYIEKVTHHFSSEEEILSWINAICSAKDAKEKLDIVLNKKF
jgi:hypothetical protein